jgi:hypothetical protein
VRLLEREADLEPFELFHFGGHWFERGVEIAEATRRVAGVPGAPIRFLGSRTACAPRRSAPRDAARPRLSRSFDGRGASSKAATRDAARTPAQSLNRV